MKYFRFGLIAHAMKIGIFLTWTLFAMSVFANESSTPAQSDIHLLIISDTHGHYDSKILYPRRKRYGIRYIHRLAQVLRTRYKNTIVLNAGDFLSGSELSRYYITHNTPTGQNAIHTFYKMLDPMIYTLGNHDLEFYTYHRPFLMRNSRLLTTANVIDTADPSAFKPAVTYPVGNTVLKVIGIATYGSRYWNDPSQSKRYRIDPPEKALRSVFEKLVIDPTDFVIGLFHTGMNAYRDFETSRLYGGHPFNQAKSLIETFPQFDLIVSGHDHRLNPSKNDSPLNYYRGVPVIEPGFWGKRAVFVTLSKRASDNKTYIKSVRVYKSDDFPDAETDAEGIDLTDYRHYLEQNTHWRLTSKTDPSECLNVMLGESLKENDNEITVLPSVKLKPFFLRKNQFIRRKHLLFWLPYMNKPVTLHLSQKDLTVLKSLQKPTGKKIPYNQKVILRFPGTGAKKQSTPPNPFAFEPFKRNVPVIMTNYHANGGGGLKGLMFLNNRTVVKRRNQTIDRFLFAYLKNTNPPKHCSMFVREAPTEDN